MDKKMVLAIFLTLAAVAAVVFLVNLDVNAHESAQTECMQAVKAFAGDKPLVRVEAVARNGQDLNAGLFEFRDDLYTYTVDKSDRYIIRIGPASNAATQKLRGETGSADDAHIREQAIDVFKKAMARLLKPNATVQAGPCSVANEDYTVEVLEEAGGAPTGNRAGVQFTKTGRLLGGVFLKATGK